VQMTPSLRRVASVWSAVAVTSACALSWAAAGTDGFLGRKLSSAWEIRSTGDATYYVQDRELHVEAPGRHWLGPLDADSMNAPMFLMEPPADATSISFETRLRFKAGRRTPVGATAGLVIVRRDMEALAKVQAARARSRLSGEWWDGGSGGGGAGTAAFQDGEDIWMRLEHDGDDFAVLHKGAERDDWVDATEHMVDSFPFIDYRFEPGSYYVGLFVTSGLEAGNDVEVAFDYFHSPELRTLTVEPGGKVALTWADMKLPSR